MLSELKAAHGVIALNSVAIARGGEQETPASALPEGVSIINRGSVDVEAGEVSIGSGEDIEVPVEDSPAAWLRNSQATAAAVAEKLEEWRHVVGSHQSASRVLRWSTSGMGTSP